MRRAAFFSISKVSLQSIFHITLFSVAHRFENPPAKMASTLSAYNTRDSPFLDLDSPFTTWYALLGAAKPKNAWRRPDSDH